MSDQLQDVRKLLETSKNILLTSHRNPDGDALGSTLALYHYLRAKGHTVRVAYPSEFPPMFSWMPGSEEVRIFDTQTEEVSQWMREADLVFLCDFNGLDRIDKMSDVLVAVNSAPRIMIDHHLNPEDCADVIISQPSASSTCEMVFDFITGLGDEAMIDEKVATCIYTGLVTDTGSFRFSTSPKVFRTVARLIEMGVNDTMVQDLIHNSQTEKILRLLGYCLYHRMEILDEFKTGIITLSRKDYENWDIQRGDTEGVVNYILSIRDIRVAVFVTEQPNIVKLSMRSKGNFSVQEICREHFRGGGHRNAAGGYSHANLGFVVRKVKEILPQYKDRILADAQQEISKT